MSPTSMLLLLIGAIAVLCGGNSESAILDLKEQECFVNQQLLKVKGNLDKFRQLLELGKSKATMKKAWVIHEFFKEAWVVQNMLGNYCKGEQHYLDHFRVNLEPLEKAIVQLHLFEKYGVEQHVVVDGKEVIAKLIEESLMKERIISPGNENENLKEMVKEGISLMIYFKQIARKLHEYHQKQGKRLGLDKEFDESITKNQGYLDGFLSSIREMANQEKNPFEKLLKTDQILELAAKLWKAIVRQNSGNKVKEEEEEKEEESGRKVISAYNEFARKLEQFLDNGALNRNMYGKFNLASIDQKLSEMKASNGKDNWNGSFDENFNMPLLDRDFLLLIRQLLYAYYQLELPPMDVLKLRGTEHISLSIGLIEYDLMYTGPNREKFKERLDEYTSGCSKKKAMTIFGNSGLIKLSEAENLFYQMANYGWDYDHVKKEKICGTFAWNFLCDLFKGECPRRDELPRNFLEMDRIQVNEQLESVFNQNGKLRFPIGKFLADNNNSNKLDLYNNNKCVLKSLPIVIKLDGMGIPRERLDSVFPLRFVYRSGKYLENQQQKNGQQQIILNHIFTDEQQLEEVFINNNNKGILASIFELAAETAQLRHFTVRAKVYSCKVQGGKEVAYVEKMCVADQVQEHYHNFEPRYRLEIQDKGYRMEGLWIEYVDLAKHNVFTFKLSEEILRMHGLN